MRRLVAVLLAGGLLLALSGCGPYAARSFPAGVDADSVPGTWTHADGATVVLAADGTFSYTELPAGVDTGSGRGGSSCADNLEASTDRTSGTGEWTLTDDHVRLGFDTSDIALLPYGFLNFTGLEYLCDIDGPAYRFDRQD